MKVLKMQGGDAGKQSKALSCAGSWRAIDLQTVNRTSAFLRRDRGTERPRCPALFTTRQPRCPRPLNAPLGHPSAGRAPPFAGCPRALALLLVFCFWGIATPSALATPSLSATVEVHVSDAGTDAPIAGATVQLDLDADGSFEPDQGEPMALTDAAGLAFFDQIVGVEDQDARPRSWRPTRIHLSRPAYRIGAGGEAVVKYALPEGFQIAHAAFHDLRGRRLGPLIPLTASAQGTSVQVPLGHARTATADGMIFLVVQCDGRTSAVKLVNLSGGLEGARLVGSSLDEAIDLGWASGELVDKAQAEADARKASVPDKDDTPSQDINVVAIHPDYETAVQAETIFEGLNNIELVMVPSVGTVVAQGRTGDEIGNLIPGGQWVFTNTSSGEEYVASLDDLGNWNVALPDTIPSDRVMDVRFEGDGYRTKTFTFMKSDESSATGTEFTGVDIFEQSGGQTTRGVLTYDLGHVALTFSQASAENDTILYMIRAQGNDGVVKWTEPVRKPYNRLDDQVSGEYIGDGRKAQQENALNFVAGIEGLPGEITCPFYESTLAVQEGNGYPQDPNGWVVAQMRNDTNAGNIRGPPPADETFTYLVGWSPWNDFTGNTLTLEFLEAMGLNDYISGSNHHGVSFDPDTDAITGLNKIGQVVLSVANTYLPGDFAIPASRFSAPDPSIEGFETPHSTTR